eukprot:m.81567 g.81567  ORF g.81567 m.81567 type:complete len:132 (+) comp14574_c1_seq7:738-1133(+)
MDLQLPLLLSLKLLSDALQLQSPLGLLLLQLRDRKRIGRLQQQIMASQTVVELEIVSDKAQALGLPNALGLQSITRRQLSDKRKLATVWISSESAMLSVAIQKTVWVQHEGWSKTLPLVDGRLGELNDLGL